MTTKELQDLLTQAESAEQRGRYDEAEQQALLVLGDLGMTSSGAEESRDNSSLRANAIRLQGVVSFRRGDFDKALKQLNEALALSEEREDHLTTSRALCNIGVVYGNLSENLKALEYFTKALSIDEEIGNKAGIASSLGYIGIVYSTLSDYPKAMEYYGRALSLHEELGNKAGIALNFNSISNTYGNLAEYSKALEFSSKALGIYEDIGNKAGIALSLSHIGGLHDSLSDYPKALEYYDKALNINEEIGNKAGVARNLALIANVDLHLSDFSKALENTGRALSINEELGNKHGIASSLNNIGAVHLALSDYPKALEYYNTALSISEEIGVKLGVSVMLGNIGNVYKNLNDYANAFDYYGKALIIDEELGNNAGVARHLGNIGATYMKLSDYVKAHEYIERSHRMMAELGQKAEAGLGLALLGELYAIPDNPNRDEAKAEQYLLDCIAVEKELGTKRYDPYKKLADLYKQQMRWKESLECIYKYHELKDEVLSEEAQKTAMQVEQRKQIAEREKELAITQAAAEARMSATTTLLYKVLPESVATRMIHGDEEIADYFPQVSILFADIAGFTPLSADMPAIIVVRFLNYVFGQFDRILKKHGCEKIKTIGDGYMAVCGAPIEVANHAERLAAAALEMQESITLPESIREHLPTGTTLGVRIGLHTGSVVAGVIGQERFVYDLYSDAVNTAARMESHGQENRIHCSNDFYRHMQNRFAMTKNTEHGFVFEKRGEIEIKGKGMMRTYFLEKA